MIKPLYKSFIPYLLLLVVIIVVVFIFDAYAERISREPELIYLGSGERGADADNLSLQMGSEIALNNETDHGADSLYMEVLDLFRDGQYQQAQEKAATMRNTGNRSPDTWNLTGLIAVRLMEYTAAEASFTEALRLDPAHHDARINLASLFMGMHRYGEAESNYRQAQQEDPNNPSIHYNLGLLYKETDRLRDAVDAFTLSAGLASGNRKSRALCQLGMSLLELNDTLQARKNLEEAILQNPRNELARIHLALTFNSPAARESELLKVYSLNPSSFQANFYLARLYRDDGALSRAELHYKKALEKQPYHMQVMDELGDLLIDQGRMEEAELVLSGFAVGDTLPQSYFYQAKIAAGEGSIPEAIRLYRLAIAKSYDGYPEACLNIAILYNQADSTEQAIRSYLSAIEARPNYSLAYFNLGVLYTEVDSVERAIGSYLESTRIDPTATKSWYNLGRLYEGRSDGALAIDAFERAIENEPGYTKARLSLANTYLRSEDLSSAIGQYRELLELYPHYGKAWFNLGLAYSRNDQPEEAISAYERLIEIDPENVRARINLAILYSRAGSIRLAISVLEDAMDLETDNPDIRFNLGLQYKKQEDYDDAIHQFMQVIALDPEYEKAYEQLMSVFNELDDPVNYEITAFRQMKQFSDGADFYSMGKRLQEAGLFQMAIEAYELAMKEGDDRDWLLYWMGKAYLDLEEAEEAIGWFDRVLERDPSHKFSIYRLGQAYELLDDSVRAERYYSELLAMDQDFRIVHMSPL